MVFKVISLINRMPHYTALYSEIMRGCSKSFYQGMALTFDIYSLQTMSFAISIRIEKDALQYLYSSLYKLCFHVAALGLFELFFLAET